jgi:peptidoglycan-associated lipoprotein
MGQEFLASVDSTINFEYNSYVLSDKSKTLLVTQVEVILKLIENYKTDNKVAKIVVEGHTDERGTREYNLALGEKRATATAKFLESRGVPSINIQVISYGKERPVLDEHTEEVWAINRRTVTILTN